MKAMGFGMNKTRVDDFSVLLLSLIIIIINEPFLSRIIQGAGILALMALFMLVNIRRFIQNGVLKNNALLLGALYIGLEVLYGILGLSNTSLIYYYYRISFLFFAIAVTPIVGSFTKRQQNIILIAIIGSVLVMMVTNIQLSNKYGAYYIRLVDYYNGRTNIINTQYVSSLVVFCGVLLAKIRESKKNNLIALGVLLFSIYFVIAIGQRLTAILLLFATLMAQIAFSGKKSTKKYLDILAILIIGIGLAVNYETVLRWVATTLNNARLTHRINQMLYALNSRGIEGSGGSLEVRYNLVITSLRTFTSSVPRILFGAGDHTSNDLIIGNHSQWIDQLAKFGILGSALLFFTIKKCFKDLMRSMELKKGNELYSHYLIIVVYFILRGLLGNVLYPYFGIMLFVFMPIIFQRIKSEKYIGG